MDFARTIKIDRIAEQVMSLFQAQNTDPGRIAKLIKLLGEAHSLGYEEAVKDQPHEVRMHEQAVAEHRTQFIRDNVVRIYVQLRREAFEEAQRHGFVPDSEANSVVLMECAWIATKRLWDASKDMNF